MTAAHRCPGAHRAKGLFIKTYGCQMNQYDSGRMARVLADSGYREVSRADEAELVILNTCHIREKATEKVFSELGRLRRLKAEAAARGGRVMLAVAGCVAQAEGEEITARAPWVDMVFGPQSYHRLPELVVKAGAMRVDGTVGARLVDTEFSVESKFDHLPAQPAMRASAFLTVQEGCDKFCSFCVVPYTRGAEVSRSAAEVLEEARRLVAGGAREITLLGQNVNAWHGRGPAAGEWTLGELIAELAEIGGLDRIRYTTSHPRDMDETLIAAHRDVPKLMPYLHLPVQSGSDRVLRAMNRRHGTGLYLETVERLRRARPDLALSSDFIVGHPGETERDFEATLDLVREVGYAQAYSFRYSPRPGTPAAGRVQVPDAAKAERLARLQALLNEQQHAFNRRAEGTVQPVLVERSTDRAGQLAGRGPYMQAVHFDGPDRLIGSLVRVRIVRGLAKSLSGRLEPGPSQEENCRP